MNHSTERPYRSHSRPACQACRKRKSRCKTEGHSQVCMMCRVHGTACMFMDGSDTALGQAAIPPGIHAAPSAQRAHPRRPTPRARRAAPLLTPASSHSGSHLPQQHQQQLPPPLESLPVPGIVPSRTTSEDLPPHSYLWPMPPPAEVEHHQRPNTIPGSASMKSPVTLDLSEEDNNSHIVGPAVSTDHDVLADYLSGIQSGVRGVRIVRPGQTGTVMFTRVKKRPYGLPQSVALSSVGLRTIEKLLEPWGDHLVALHFEKVNNCIPLLDETSFKEEFAHSKERISPALLGCLYAHTMTFWRASPVLAKYRQPDARFIWNLATEALYSELHVSPGISTIIAILLNISGRPVTSIIGNGVQLGSAVSLCHSLGLNRNPLSWDIPESEKHLRMKIWWCVLIHDRWSSLAYGTPPHIQRQLYDVPAPKISYLEPQGDGLSAPTSCNAAAHVFIALYGLTDVLDRYMEQVYRLDEATTPNAARLELLLDEWIATLVGDVRLIIVRESLPDNIPGAANLRLCYLAVRLLLSHILLDGAKKATSSGAGDDAATLLDRRYMQARRTAEDIVLFAQGLRESDIRDFWLPVGAFTFSSTVGFLLRCTLEMESSALSIQTNSPALKMAKDMLDCLRDYQTKYNWDLGDTCLAKYGDIVDKMPKAMTELDLGLQSSAMPQQMDMSDSLYLDILFPNIWDSLGDLA